MLQIEFFQRNLQNLEKNWKKMTLCQLEIGTFKRNLKKHTEKKVQTIYRNLWNHLQNCVDFGNAKAKKKTDPEAELYCGTETHQLLLG